MGFIVGVVLALLVSVLARLTGFDRDRAFYPTLLVVIASYYILFAVMGGSIRALLVESVVMIMFAGVAFVGFKRNLWLVAVALAGHGVFDLLHGHLVTNPGVPAWWPTFCMAYDVIAAVFLAWLLTRFDLARQGTVSLPASRPPIPPAR
jgi:hypothetical protein